MVRNAIKGRLQRKNGNDMDQLYISNWKFYISLHFLKDSFTQRISKNNLTEDLVYLVQNPPIPKIRRKPEERNISAAERVMQSATIALEAMSNDARNMEEKSDNHYFCDMLLKISESEEKALQQRVVKEQFRSKRSNLLSLISSPPRISFSPPGTSSQQMWTSYK